MQGKKVAGTILISLSKNRNRYFKIPKNNYNVALCLATRVSLELIWNNIGVRVKFQRGKFFGAHG